MVCTASDQCHEAGTCDPATGSCSNPAKADGAACSDGNVCTTGEICQAGVCTGGQPSAGCTTVGTNVSVQPVGAPTGTTVTFSNVISGGTTTLTTSSSGPTPPSGFKLGNPATYYDIDTTAVFSGPVGVCINYTGVTFKGKEANLKLSHFEDTDGDGIADAWVDSTLSLDTTNNIICASVTSLSPFAIFEPFISVAVDIKPGSFPNSINLKSKGVIPVAILTTGTFNATTVDPSTVCFGDGPSDPTNSDCTEAHGTGHIEDTDGDGDLDLVLHYETGQTGIDLGDTQACLTGETFDGTAIEGCDSVKTL